MNDLTTFILNTHIGLKGYIREVSFVFINVFSIYVFKSIYITDPDPETDLDPA